MKKPISLRDALFAAIPEFKNEPDRIDLWVENGGIKSTATPSEAFGFSYRLNILLEETSTDIAYIALALFRWLRVNQPDLMAAGAAGVGFDADILDNGSADIMITLDLTENVSLQIDDEDKPVLVYLAEPDPLFTDHLAPSPLADDADLPPLSSVLLDLQADGLL